MSRLFEALSGLKTEHRATEAVAPPAVAPPVVIRRRQGRSETEQHSPKVVRPTLGPLALAHAEPAQE